MLVFSIYSPPRLKFSITIIITLNVLTNPKGVSTGLKRAEFSKNKENTLFSTGLLIPSIDRCFNC